jgi:hypothetical protein
VRESNEIEKLFGGKNSESLKEVVLHLVGEFILESKKAGGLGERGRDVGGFSVVD